MGSGPRRQPVLAQVEMAGAGLGTQLAVGGAPRQVVSASSAAEPVRTAATPLTTATKRQADGGLGRDAPVARSLLAGAERDPDRLGRVGRQAQDGDQPLAAADVAVPPTDCVVHASPRDSWHG